MARISIARGSGATEFSSRSSIFSFDLDDMADPSSYFDVDLALPLDQDFRHRASASGHRPSKSSSDSKDFDFKLCMLSPPDLVDSSASSASNLISPADELFYKGKLLPLYMSQRLQHSKNEAADSEHRAASKILAGDRSVSCYLHRMDMVLDPPAPQAGGDESSTSRESSRNSREKDLSTGCDSSSRDSSEEESSVSSFRRLAAKNTAINDSGRLRSWNLFSLGGGHKRGSGSKARISSNCAELCKSCGQRRSSTEARDFSASERKRFDTFSSSPHAGLQQTRSSDKLFMPRHSTGGISGAGLDAPAHSKSGGAYHSLFRAKEFWRKYLKPFIAKTSQEHRSYFRPPEVEAFAPPDRSSPFLRPSRQRPSRSTSVTPLASPTHSGVLLSAPAPVANAHDVQGAIAYCRQSRAS